jgi:single-stranded-DNA-specific exonuclease
VFRDCLNRIATERINPELMIPSLKIDIPIDLEQIGEPLLEKLNELAPFGPQNMRPVMMASNLEVVGYPRVVGKNHLKFKVRKNDRALDVIAFNQGERLGDLQVGKPTLSLAFVLEENRWQGRSSLQLRAKDIKIGPVNVETLS